MTAAAQGRTGNCLRRKVHTRAYVVGYGRPPHVASAPVAPAVPATYEVREGDTLSGIAASSRTTVAALQRLNRTTNPDVIMIGQLIKLG